jgi:hypothetical protein
VLVATLTLDHRADQHTFAIAEVIELPAGQARTFNARNDYGTANHFSTYVGTQTRAVELAVTLVDTAGTETARFNDDAFMTRDGDLDRMRRVLDRKQQGDAANDRRLRRGRHDHQHEGSSAIATPT